MERKIKLVNRIRRSRRRNIEIEHGVEIEHVRKRERRLAQEIQRKLGVDQQISLGGPSQEIKPMIK